MEKTTNQFQENLLTQVTTTYYR